MSEEPPSSERVYGGIGERTLKEVIEKTISEHHPTGDDDLQLLKQQVADTDLKLTSKTDLFQKEIGDLHHWVDKLNSRLERRPDFESQLQASQQLIKQKVDFSDFTTTLAKVEHRMEERVRQMDHRLDQRLESLALVANSMQADLTDLADRILRLDDRTKKMEVDVPEQLGKLDLQVEQKLEASELESALGDLERRFTAVLSQKAEVEDIEEKFGSLGFRMEKAEANSADEQLSVLHQRIMQRMGTLEDRLEHLEEEHPDFENAWDRLENVEQKVQEHLENIVHQLQQKVDNTLLDDSLDELESKLDRKAEDMHDRINVLERRLKSEGQGTGVRVTKLEERVAQKAEDLRVLKQELSGKVDADFVKSAVASDRLAILQEVENLSLAQRKQLNLSPGATGTSSGSASSGFKLQDSLLSKEHRPVLALQNGPDDSPPAANPPRKLRVAKAGSEQGKASPSSSSPTTPRKTRTVSRTKALSPAAAADVSPQLARSPTRLSRSPSRNSDLDVENQLRPPRAGPAAVGVPKLSPIRGPDAWRGDQPEQDASPLRQRQSSREQAERSGRSPDRSPQALMGMSNDISPRGDVHPGQAFDEVSPRLRSASGRSGNGQVLEDRSPPKLTASRLSGPSVQMQPPRVWACRRSS